MTREPISIGAVVSAGWEFAAFIAAKRQQWGAAVKAIGAEAN